MKKVLVGLAVVVVLVLICCGVGFGVSSDYRVERSTDIAAPPAAVHSTVADLTTWKDWTVWTMEADPTTVWEYTGEPGTVGHSMEWQGDVHGHGLLTITAVHENGGIDYDMEMEHGQWTSEGSVLLAPDDDGTTVTWAFWGEAPMMMSAALDGMVGPDFEGGLAGLRSRHEGGAAPAEETPDETVPEGE